MTFWDDPFQDGSVTIINIFELFKQTTSICALIRQDMHW